MRKPGGKPHRLPPYKRRENESSFAYDFKIIGKSLNGSCSKTERQAPCAIERAAIMVSHKLYCRPVACAL